MKNKELMIIAASAAGVVVLFSSFIGGGNITDISGQLPKNGTYPQRRLSQISKIVIHHSVNDYGTPIGYARYHIQKHGWPGIAYHYVIMPDGKTYQTAKLNWIGYHAKGSNTNGIGICLSGNFENHPPTEAQYRSAISLSRILKSRFGITELGGHNEYGATACPGRYCDVNRIRENA